MKRKSISGIALTQEQEKAMMQEIAAFYNDEFGEEIGIIKQQQILTLFQENLAPVIYNKALEDAKRWYAQIQDNMESDYFTLYKEVR